MAHFKGGVNVKYNINLYDWLDLNNENSLTLIMNKVKKNSVVLEFGPAYGRLTQYLKEELGCQVYCIEIDSEAIPFIKNYTVEVLNDDIENYKWLDKWQDISFDYIIFADVLEHLHQPDKVLSNSKKLLKNDGTILFSVPNIAHVAILDSLYNNLFEYQKTGILDETHLRFFTYYSIEQLCQNVGLKPIYKTATYYTTEMTGINTGENSSFLEKSLKFNEKDFPYVYQFIYGVKKEEFSKEESCDDKLLFPRVKNTLQIILKKNDCKETYYTQEYDCLKRQVISFEIPEDKANSYISIQGFPRNCFLRFFSIKAKTFEGQSIEISDSDITSNAAAFINHTFYFTDTDPYISCNILQKFKYFIFEFLTIPVKSNLGVPVKEMMDFMLFKQQGQLYALRQSMEQLLLESQERAIKISQLSSERDNIKDESEKRAIKIAELNSQVSTTQQESFERGIKIAELNSQLLFFQQESLERGNKLAELNSQVSAAQQECFERGVRISQLESEKAQLNQDNILAIQELQTLKDTNQKILSQLIKYEDKQLKENLGL